VKRKDDTLQVIHGFRLHCVTLRYRQLRSKVRV
jgi:hypothetical protein